MRLRLWLTKRDGSKLEVSAPEPNGIENYILSEYQPSFERYLNSTILLGQTPEGWTPPTPTRRQRLASWRRGVIRRLTPVVLVKRSTIDRLEDEADVREFER